MKLNRYISLTIVTLFFMMIAPTLLVSMDHDVTYVEGLPYARNASGDERDIDTGDVVQTGDTVITETGDFVELEASGYTVKINENTVFSIREIEAGGQKSDVLSCALGKLSFSRDKFLGNEPRLATSSAICGVRGTNFALLAGVDGSSLIVVEEGSVEVAAAGEAVEVGKAEGVEVITGSAPGDIFKAPEKAIDFSTWNQGRLDVFLKDPIASAEKVKTQLQSFIAEIKKIHPIYLDTMKSLKEQQGKMNEILEKKGKEEAKKYGKANLAPLMINATNLYMNIRFLALSSLSLRRFISGRMYIILKAKYVLNPGDATYKDFLKVHSEILGLFESEVVPQFIVLADI